MGKITPIRTSEKNPFLINLRRVLKPIRNNRARRLLVAILNIWTMILLWEIGAGPALANEVYIEGDGTLWTWGTAQVERVRIRLLIMESLNE